jgi:hypothetical protein
MSSAGYAEMSATVTTEKASLFIYEPFTIRLDVVADAPPEMPEFPNVPDLEVVTTRRVTPDSALRKHSFRIELIAERDGTLTIPPFAVRSRGEAVSTSALQLQIQRPRAASEMALNVSVQPTSLRVGQPADVTVTWRSAVSFERCRQLLLNVPLLADERLLVFPLEPAAESKSIGLPVNGIRVVAEIESRAGQQRSLVVRYKLVPREPGVLRPRPALMRCALLENGVTAGQAPSYFYNHFFEAAGDDERFEEVYLTKAVPEIRVREVPAEGRTARYAGIVGPCTLDVSLMPRQLTVGQPALFTVELRDLAFTGHISSLPSVTFAALRREFRVSQDPIRGDSTNHSRSFTYVIRPLRAEVTQVPAVVMQIFDPKMDRFQTLRSKPIPISVETGEGNDQLSMVSRVDSARPISLHGVRHNRFSEPPMNAIQHVLEFLGHYWWGFLLAPPMLWLLLRPTARRWERCRRDAGYARALAARGRFRRMAWRDEEAAWRCYLADRLGLCVDVLTAETVAEALRARDVDADLIAATRRRFEEKDATDYGKRPPTSCRDTHRLVARLHKATVPMLFIIVSLAALNARASDRSDVVFSRAMQLYGEKPDVAQTLFVDAALQFEQERRFLNAGNSWFFAGENGRALANYRAAERRAPFDRQLRESIRFLRATRVDAFPAKESIPENLWHAWVRFGTWDPVLRAGAFITAYLLAWCLFIVTRLSGWRIPRSMWLLLAVLVSLPLWSLVHTALQPSEGVIIEDCVARLGPGYAYDPAFQQPLHQATEFNWLETRRGWVRVQLPDATEGWLPEFACMEVK